jgi:hypothetical protein
VNDSGEITSVDAALALQRVARLISSLPNQPAGDVDRDGEITSIDAALILQFAAGLLGELTC